MNRGEVLRVLRQVGIHGTDVVPRLRALPRFLKDLKEYKRQAENAGAAGRETISVFPCLSDFRETSGVARGHYFHQDLLVARRIFERNPVRHIDVGSRVDGFVAHVAVFRQIEVLDVRKQEERVQNIVFLQADLMNEAPGPLRESADSVSCLHALEHFGLGRYGDRVDFEGHLRGFNALDQILKPEGVLYRSVPIGPKRVEFNAHRVLPATTLLAMFARRYDVVRFSYVDDEGRLFEDVPLFGKALEANFGCHYGCGIVEAVKKRNRT